MNGKRPSRKRRFSLIELLIVVAIIGILMGILLPVFVGMREKGKIQRARQEMSAIEAAIKSYESQYGILPNLGYAAELLTDDEYKKLMDVLTYVDGPTVGGVNDFTKNNTRAIRFLDVPADYTTKSYVDPWGNPYKVILDINYDKQITASLVDADNSGGTPNASDILYGSVYIYSLGPDKADQNGTLYNGKTGDIPTWRTSR